jgi:hypothetical protein
VPQPCSAPWPLRAREIFTPKPVAGPDVTRPWGCYHHERVMAPTFDKPTVQTRLLEVTRSEAPLGCCRHVRKPAPSRIGS